jgi:hypothetical protein
MSSFVRVEVKLYFFFESAILPTFDLSLGYRQIKLSPKDHLDVVSSRGFHLSASSSPSV